MYSSNKGFELMLPREQLTQKKIFDYVIKINILGKIIKLSLEVSPKE